MKLLIIEDSERLRRSLGRGLEKLGWTVDSVSDGDDGLEHVLSYDYDAVVLDLMLPGLSGLELLRRARAAGRNAHVLILSPKDQVEDRVRGLELGADDYLVKPFAFDELVARLQALVRRRYGVKSPHVAIGELELDTTAKAVTRDGEKIELTAQEYALLELLALRRGRVATREEIWDHLHGAEAEVSSNAVDVLVYSLRRKIDRPGSPSLIRTRRGFGYVVE